MKHTDRKTLFLEKPAWKVLSDGYEFRTGSGLVREAEENNNRTMQPMREYIPYNFA
jgi:hypothetical protein